MPQGFLRANVDFSKDFIRGAARILFADLTTPFPTYISDIIKTTTAGQTNEVQTVTITGTPTGGTFRLSFKGYTTGTIPYSASAAVVDAALEALTTIGSGGVTVSGGPGPGTPYVVTFTNQLGNQTNPLITANSSGLTGGTTPSVGVVRTTAGTGQYEAASTAWTDVGATKGGITINRNNAEEAFTVDQVNANILALPNAWECSVSTQVARADIDTLQWVWEGGAITVDGGTGERTLGLGTPVGYRHRRLAVGFQRPDVTGSGIAGAMRFYCFRDVNKAAGESSITHSNTGDQSTPAMTWTANADQNQVSDDARFGTIIDQV